MMKRAGWALGLATAMAATACGGTVTSVAGNDGGSSPGSDGGPGSDGPHGPFCPASPPAAAAACQPIGLECEYGTDPNAQCNQLFLCDPSGTWQEMTSGGICLPPDAAAACPATYASVPTSKQCSPDQLQCDYPQGTCFCTTNHGGPTGTQNPTWGCVPTPPGCPSTRPHLGDACSQPNLDCNYGACSGGIDVVCKGGFWQEQRVPCPV